MCSINIDNTKESYIQVLQANHGDVSPSLFEGTGRGESQVEADVC